MRAISLQQPWADLVVTGRKTLDLRSWMVSYRGPVAIHASLTVNKKACHALGIDPKQVTTGALVGIVELVDIFQLDAQTFTDRGDEHLAGEFFPAPAVGAAPIYGWVLVNPRAIDPIPYTGHMSLFTIPDEVFNRTPLSSVPPVIANPTEQSAPAEQDDEAIHATHPFELRVVPETVENAAQAAYRLALFQRVVQASPAQKTSVDTVPAKMRPLAELGGGLLRSVADAVLETLRQNSYAATDLGTGRREPFHLNEESGVRLGLIFLSVRPITKMTRVEDISRGIRAMTKEELYYWFSKCTGPNAERAQKALRNLLADE